MSDELRRIARTLSMTEMFIDLSNEQLEIIASICQPIECSAGHIIFEENTSSDEMYVIGRGEIEILVDPSFVSAETGHEHVVIAQLRQGDLIGEMALVDQGLRSATARVSKDNTYLIRLPRIDLMRVCKEHPDMGFLLMQNLAADLALKIRNTDLTLRQYQLQLMYANANSSTSA